MHFFYWITKSLRNKALITLILLGVLPLLISGIIINTLTSRLLVQKMNYMAEQTIDNLSLLVSKDLQGFIDTAFYSAQNKNLKSLIAGKLIDDNQKQNVFFKIRYELYSKQLISHADYPYHYILITKSGEVFTNFYYLDDAKKRDLIDKLNKSDWFRLLSNSITQKILIRPETNFLSPREENQLYICTNIVNDMEPIGTLLIGVDRYYFSRLIDNVRISDQSSIFIINEDKSIVEGESNYISFDEIPADIIRSINNSRSSSLDYKIKREKEFVTFRNLYIGGAEGNWKIIMATPSGDIIKDVNYINYIILSMIMFSIVAIIFLIMLINKQIIIPVLKLNEFAKKAESGDMDVRANYTRNDEIGKLALVFNKMLENIKQNISDIKEKEEMKRKFEINILQAQINPHFIRNTLNIVRWMAEMMGLTSISKAIVSTVELINYNFSITDSTVTVKSEIKYLEEYIYLQKLRYQNKFTSKIEVAADILDSGILKLILQPIIENSIMHGFEKKKGIGRLSIKGQLADGKIVFSIKDNGVGMSRESIERVMKAAVNSDYEFSNIQRIGLSNVLQRIKLNYGDDYGILINSELNIGTEIKITLPFIVSNTSFKDISNENINNR